MAKTSSSSKRNIFIAAVAVFLAAVMAIGGTFAYFSISTDAVTNTFNANGISISLDEDGDQSYEIIPGTEEEKNPTITLETTVGAYVYLFVTDDTDGLVEYELNLDGWTVLDVEVGENTTVYYREVEADTENTWELLVDNKVSYSSALTLDDMYDEDGNLKDGLTLSFYAIAIQSDAFEDAYDAFKNSVVVEDEYIWYTDDDEGAAASIEVTEEEITLTASGTLVLTEDVDAGISVEDESEVTIDTSDYTIESDTAGVAAVSVEYGSAVTLNGDGEVSNTANQSSNTAGSAAIFNNGTLTVNGGTYSAESEDGVSWYTVINHGTMVINDGTFTNEAASTNSSLVENGYYDPDSGNSTTGYVEGVNEQYPSLTINGGTFTSSATTAIKNDECGILVINGGEFTAKTNGYAVYNYSDATINGGTFNSYVYVNYNANNQVADTVDGATLIITDGTFNAAIGRNNSNAVIEISGGTFVTDISSVVIDGYTTTENEDGTYTVTAE